MKGEPALFIIGIIIGGLAGSMIGASVQESIYEGLAIKHKCAKYNSQTSDFEWREQIEY